VAVGVDHTRNDGATLGIYCPGAGRRGEVACDGRDTGSFDEQVRVALDAVSAMEEIGRSPNE